MECIKWIMNFLMGKPQAPKVSVRHYYQTLIYRQSFVFFKSIYILYYI